MKSPINNNSTKKPLSVVLHYWGRRGGGSVLTLLLAEALRNSDRSVDVLLSLSQQNSNIQNFRASKLPIITIDPPSLSTLWRKAWSLPRQLRKHADTLASLTPDAVIMTMNSPFAWPFIRVLQRRGVRVLYVVHDAEPHPGDYAATWQRLTQDLLIKSADGLVALSSEVARRVAEKLPTSADKMTIIPLEAVYPSKRAHLPNWPLSTEPIRLLFYGRLLSYKGLDLLIQVLEPLKSRLNWQLTIAGSGPLAPTVRQAFAGWTQVDLELGWISDQRTSDLFANHHLLLCPYSEASQSGVIAEALSWAMPSVVMPTGALPEQIGFGAAGLVAETLDADGFRRCIQLVLEQPNLLVDLSRGAATLLAERQASQGWVTLIEATARA